MDSFDLDIYFKKKARIRAKSIKQSHLENYQSQDCQATRTDRLAMQSGTSQLLHLPVSGAKIWRNTGR